MTLNVCMILRKFEMHTQNCSTSIVLASFSGSLFQCSLVASSSSAVPYFFLAIIRYEKKYNEEAKLKAAEQEKAKAEKEKEIVESVAVSKPDGAEPTRTLKTSTSSAEQDLDVFLLGDLGDSDGPGAFENHCFDILGKHITLSQIPLYF